MIPAVPESKAWQGQFVVSAEAPMRDGWADKLSIGRLNLYTYGEPNRIEVNDPAGRLIGVFLGTLIDIEARDLVEGPLVFDAADGDLEIDDALESFAYRHGGSWLLIMAVAGSERVYLDSDGSMSLVYSPERRCAAATTGLILDDADYVDRFQTELYDALGVAGEGWFPSGLTAHRGVKRLLCNHYLDLGEWSIHRHWPRTDFEWDVSATDAALRVAEIVRASITALLKHGRVVRALTGGNESRFLLAADREQCREYDYVTVSAPATKRDVVLAKRLAEIAGLSHRLLRLVEASPEAQDAWLYQSSHCLTGPNMVSHPSIEPLAGYGSFVGGLGGEIGRAFFWRSSDTEDMSLTAAQIARRFGMPPNDVVTKATEEWMGQLPAMNALSVLDLAYLELRMSAWAFANSYAAPTVPHFHPMICREVYDLMLRLPPEAKRNNRLILDGVEAMWPEIARIPINSYGDYRDLLHTAKRLTKPHLVLKKLRKLIG